MDDIPPRSYGLLIETTLRIITWNVWGLYGPWREREAAIVATLRDARPDIVVLTESWAKGGDSQCARLAGPLGLPHQTFSGVTAEEDEAALSGVAVMSRWPVQRESSLAFGGARVQFAELSGPRGLIQVYGLVMDAWWFDESQARQDGLSFYDAWEVAGPPIPGHTWSNSNPWATQLLWPNRRIDYIFSATPRPGGAGHALHTALLGTHPVNSTYPSDHYALQSSLRY